MAKNNEFSKISNFYIWPKNGRNIFKFIPRSYSTRLNNVYENSKLFEYILDKFERKKNEK